MKKVLMTFLLLAMVAPVIAFAEHDGAEFEKFVVSITDTADIDAAVAALDEFLADNDITVWGTISDREKDQGFLMVKAPTDGGAKQLKKLLKKNASDLPSTTNVNDVITFEEWLSS